MPTTIIKLLEQPANKVAHSLIKEMMYTLLQTIFWWIPKGSPDYDRRLVDVMYWFIEIDNDTSRAEREIGFNAHGLPILYAPTDQNMGLWTDSDREFTEAKYETVDAQEFNLLWLKLQNTTGSNALAN